MGTRMAPSYANLLMANLDEKLMASTSTRPKVWWWYIDNIFAIWEHGQESLDTFLQQINLFHPTTKFTVETSTEQVTFLVILEDDTLHTDLYTKPTDTHQYLSPSSCHPKHCTTTIPYSQGLRLRRICSRREDFEKRLNKLRDHLLACDYEANSIDRQIQRAALMPRTQALQPRPQQQQPRCVSLVATYHPRLTTLTKNKKTPPHTTCFQEAKTSHLQPTPGNLQVPKELEEPPCPLDPEHTIPPNRHQQQQMQQ